MEKTSERGGDGTAVAIDLGAQSGRVTIGWMDDGKLRTVPVHRFPNGPTIIEDRLLWNPLRLLEEVRGGLAKAAATDPGASTVAITGWGLDYALLNADDLPLGPVFHHRDRRTAGVIERALVRVSRERIYGLTGTQFLPVNTLDQLLSVDPQLLDAAAGLLMIPNLLGCWLTGGHAVDPTLASTTQLFDLRRSCWSDELIGALGLPRRLFPNVAEPEEGLGAIRHQETGAVGFHAPPIVKVGVGHDTAAAVAAVPARDEDFAYVSCGTWSLVGIEAEAPIIGAAALAANVSNEIGVEGTYRILKNVNGLSILSHSLAAWGAAGVECDLATLLAAAGRLPSGAAVVDVDRPELALPGDVPTRIAELCRAAGESVPDRPARVVRLIVDSLACKYAIVLDQLAAVTGAQPKVVHVIGGGSQNALLCQATADATGLPVLAGPIEASTMGNLLRQLRPGAGGLRDGRRMIRNSIEIAEYRPDPPRARSLEGARSRLVAAGAR